jgi:hypothetical protein
MNTAEKLIWGKRIKEIKDAKTDEDILKILREIYNDGFEDGRNDEGNEPYNGQREPVPWEDLD